MLQIQALTQTFHGHRVLDDIGLRVETGELFSLLGPSGCGKTTLLRSIAGILPVESGTVHLDGRDVTSQPMHQRNMALVFQNYALFPHLTVAQNVGFGLKSRKMPKRDIAAKVDEALDLVRLPGYGGRMPSQLSGGQQQRVAIARAVVTEPALLLMDEPLSNLDTHLREELRDDIRALQKKLSITTVLVTHDIEEALTISDRIAILRAGRIEQVGAPREIYEQPGSHFTAEFLGQPNLLEGTVVADREGTGGRIGLQLPGGRVLRAADGADAKGAAIGETAWFMLRPQRVKVFAGDEPADDGGEAVDAVVTSAAYSGEGYDLRLDIGGGAILRARTVRRFAQAPEAGQRLRVGWNTEDARILRR